MSTKIGRFMVISGLVGSLLAGGLPAIAAGHGGGGGGGHGGSGGGHFGGGSAHVAGGGGGGGGARGFAGGVHPVAAHGFAGGGYAGAGHTAVAGGHFRGSYAGGTYAGGGHAAYSGHVGGYGGGYHGYSTGAYWHGGYWNGGYWPRAYYGLGFTWFLPVLPLAYATYWYGGTPYYYANDVYYTWDPGYDGYVATDPPPAVGQSGAAAVTDAQAMGDQGAGPDDMQGASGPSSGQVFMYPKNGQSEEQQSADKQACQQWAASQADPSHVEDFRRAMIACIEGRGYSAQ